MFLDSLFHAESNGGGPIALRRREVVKNGQKPKPEVKKKKNIYFLTRFSTLNPTVVVPNLCDLGKLV